MVQQIESRASRQRRSKRNQHPSGSRPFNWIVHKVIRIANRHFRYFNGSDHGYGIVKVTKERMVATFYHFPILKVTDDLKEVTMVVRDGESKWDS